MYPGTKFNWYDQSDIVEEVEVIDIDSKPSFMVVSSFDKGPEEVMHLFGSDFNKLYGTMSFDRHGQNAIQAQNIIDAGGAVLVKRVVADDATLANTTLYAEIVTMPGEPESDDLPIEKISIKWSIGTCGNITGVKSKNEDNVKSTTPWEQLVGEVKKDLNFNPENSKGALYPLFILADNGRGASNKAVRIIPDYNTSRTTGYMFYTIAIFEGTKQIETQTISLDPDVIYLNSAYGLNKETCAQINGLVDPDIYEAFVEALFYKIKEIGSGEGEFSKEAQKGPFPIISETFPDIESLKANDLIFGYDLKGNLLPGFSEISASQIDLNAEYGIPLEGGSNGVFGNTPALNTEENKTAYEAWGKAIESVFKGEYSEEVWDLDMYKLFAVCDAAFPTNVKDAIVDFVDFREDCMYFRDLGVGLKTYGDILDSYATNCKKKSRFVADYYTTYNIKDPATKKTIEVTMMYDFVTCLAALYEAGPFRPLAGTLNGFILENAIEGSVNFTPIITPQVNRKQAIEDLRLNYAIFEGSNCVVQSLYTSQERYTQLSYANNVLAIQEVMRAIRIHCPKNRYSFSNTTDFTEYSKDVQNLLNDYASHFETLEFEYTQDPLKSAQKIFYASIKFRFGSWVQSEIFDLFALKNE